MSLGSIFTHRVRGVRLIEVWAVGLLAVLVFGVYMTKTFAGREANEITRTQAQIEQEQTRIRLLKAEVAYLEQPERIERLSQLYLHLAPMQGKRETEADRLAEIARKAPEPVANPPLAMSAVAPLAESPAQLPAAPVVAEPIDSPGAAR